MQSLTYIFFVVLLVAPQWVGCVNLRNDPVSSKLQARQSAEIAPANSTNATNLLLDHTAVRKGNPSPPRRRRRRCSAGHRSNNGLEPCQLCPNGEYQPNGGHQNCIWCTEGKVSNSNRQDCQNCGAGKFKASKTHCAPHKVCLPGSYTEAGTAIVNTICPLCALGRFGATGASCEDCVPGKYAGIEGQDSCDECLKGTTSVQKASGCSACVAGKFADKNAQACTNCAAGKYAAGGASACQSCPEGKFAGEGATECTTCPAGKSAQPESPVCEICPAGTSSGEESASCLECVPGKFSSQQEATACALCDKGKYAKTYGSEECAPAPRGNYVDQQGSPTFEKCSAGTNQSQSGQNSCEDCPAGFLSAPESEYCIPWTKCITGKEVAQIGSATSDTVCKDCDPGSFSDDAGQCELCPRGWAMPDSGAAGCTFCGLGKQVADATKELGNIGCSACAAGKRSSYSEAAMAAGAQLACDDCVAGKYANGTGADSCTLCPHGKYSDTTGGTSCTACPTGKVQDQHGATECDKCAAGKFMDIPGVPLPCEDCAIGFFSEEGATTCTQCEKGKNAYTAGSSECEDCGGSTATAAPSEISQSVPDGVFDFGGLSQVPPPGDGFSYAPCTLPWC